MDFILGIFTGISIAILWGMYLNKQREKKAAQKNPPPPPGSVGIYVDGKMIATGQPMQWEGGMKEYTPLHQQLEDAIERDDFEEAARLRDLINTKK